MDGGEMQEDVRMATEPGDPDEEENGGKLPLKDGDDDEDDDLDDLESSSDGEDEDLEIGKEVERLEQEVAASPYKYDAHVQLVFTLRKAGLLEKLRGAREAMNALYPLTPDMWREWAQDEARLALGTEDVRAVEALYDRGVHDYLSVPLWLEYLQFVEERDATVAEGTPEGVSKMRKLYEQGLAAVGLHFASGGQVWEAYREFEQALLVVISEMGGEGRSKQIENVRSLFLRQLTVPLANLPETLEQYKEWEAQQGNFIGDDSNELSGLPNHVGVAYKKSLQLCSVRELHEERIGRGKPGDADQLQHYMGYISIEEATVEPARAQILFERAVAAFPISQDIWVKYSQYLETNLKVASVLKSVYARAVRNCPWVVSLWKSYLLALERFHTSDSEISAVFEQSLQGGFQTPQEFLDLFLIRCDGLRRQIMATEEGTERQSSVSILHDTFNRASQFLSTYFPDFADRTLQLHAYWADMEAHVAKDMAAARGVWEGLIQSSGRMIEIWQAYILMEVSLKNIKEARAIYRICYSRRWEGNGTKIMCNAWLRFEREHGSLEDYDRAVVKVAPRLAEVESMQAHQEAISVQNFLELQPRPGVTELKTKVKEKLTRGPTNVQASVRDSDDGKRKRGLGFKEPKPVLKRQRLDKQEDVQDNTKVPNAETKVEYKRTPMVSPVTNMDMDAVSQKKPTGAKSSRLYTDDCTAFVSNIAFEVTEEQLTEFFSSVAGVKEVRLLKDKFSGRPRGLAYVDFEDAESLAAAISKDKEELAGRQLTVARSAPKSGRGGGRSSAGEGRGGRGGWQGRGGGEERRGDGIGGRSRGGGALGHRRGGKVSMTGNNTFAVPRTVVRPLGWNPGQAATGNETAKSNDEFRKMLLSKK